jgi:hypothetical protein
MMAATTSDTSETSETSETFFAIITFHGDHSGDQRGGTRQI